MDVVSFIISIFAVSLSSMALSLSLMQAKWKKCFTVLEILLVLSSMMQTSSLLISSSVYNKVCMILISFTLALAVFTLPLYVLNDLSKRQKIVFAVMFLAVFVLGLIKTITVLEVSICLAVILYCLLKLVKTGSSDNYEKKISHINLVMCLILFVLGIIVIAISSCKGIAYSAFVIVFSLAMLMNILLSSNSPSQDVKVSQESLDSYHITDRELEVIKAICMGKSNKEIASDMRISVNTVNNHVANIFEKMNISSRMDLMRIMKSYPCT